MFDECTLTVIIGLCKINLTLVYRISSFQPFSSSLTRRQLTIVQLKPNT